MSLLKNPSKVSFFEQESFEMSYPVPGCDTESITWICIKCGHDLGYDEDFHIFTCLCGSYSPEVCKFMCPNHGLKEPKNRQVKVS